MFFGSILGIAGAFAPIADVRVGDDGALARIEIVCSRPCEAEPLSDQSFLIRQAKGDFTADVRAQSRWVQSIEMRSSREGAALTVKTIHKARAVLAVRCGPMRLCFDFDLSMPKPTPPRVTIAGVDADLDRLFHKARLAELVPGDIADASKNDAGCGAAERALAEDAWNLYAYRTVAVCRAREGDPAAAERYLARQDRWFAARRQTQGGLRTGMAALR